MPEPVLQPKKMRVIPKTSTTQATIKRGEFVTATRIAAGRCRNGNGPALLIAETFRMGGHATHDEREARETFSAELFTKWGKRDPIGLYEEYLKEEGIAASTLDDAEREVTQEVERAAAEALASRDKMPAGVTALEGVYASRN